MTLHKMIDGVEIELTPDEIAQQQASDNYWTAESAKRSAISQIIVLESIVTQRRLREATLGTDGGWLANLNSQIATLRGQLT